MTKLISQYKKAVTDYRKSTERLSREQEDQLILEAQAGNIESRNRVVEEHLPMSISIASSYKNASTIDFEDLIQQGNDGLIYAIGKYKVGSKAKFGTYAYNWVRQRIIRYIEENRFNVRIAVSRQAEYGKIRKIIDEYTRIMGEEPSYEMIAEMLIKQEIKKAFDRDATEEEIQSKLKTRAKKVEETIMACQYEGSLDFEIGTDKGEEMRVMDVIEDELHNTEDDVENKIMLSLLRDSLGVLSSEQRFIICSIYGLGTERLSKKELALSLGNVTPSKINKIEKEIIELLRKQISPNLVGTYYKTMTK